MISSNKKIAVFLNLPGGGSVRVIKKVTDYLRAENHTVDIYSICEHSTSNWLSNIWDADIERVLVKPWRGFFPRIIWILFILPKIHKRLAHKLMDKKYDCLLVTHDYFTKSPYILNYYPRKKIYILHEPQREYYESWKFHAPYLKDKLANIFRFPLKFIDKKNASKSDVIIANSKYSQKVIQKVYGKPSYLMYPGVDPQVFKPLGKKENILLYVGGISKIKGCDFVIKALAPLLGTYKLVMIGDGRDREKRSAINIASDKADSIKIINHVKEEEIVRYFQKAKVLCIAGYKEPFGLTSLEAQACMTPVVCINEGGVPETINPDKTGYVSNRDQKEYLEKVQKAIDNQEVMAISCREWVVKNWTWDVTLRRINKIIQNK